MKALWSLSEEFVLRHGVLGRLMEQRTAVKDTLIFPLFLNSDLLY